MIATLAMGFDAEHFRQWIQSLGFWGGHMVIWAIVFAESGLFIGFFLPGDSLLFTAGFIASLNPPTVPVALLDIRLLLLGCAIAAVAGDTVGYWTGKWFGDRLSNQGDTWWYKRKHLAAAQKFYDKHGRKTIVIARFMPIVRTFAPIVAGMAAMNYKVFATFNVIGGIGWAVGLTSIGYALGKRIPPDKMDKYLLPIILAIIIISLLPSVWHLYQERRNPQ
jgi:membrane-associated protein